MCLYEVKKIRIEEDITVYKVLQVSGKRKFKYHSPYYKTEWIEGVRKSVPENQWASMDRTIQNFDSINKGAYHSFKTLASAKSELRCLESWEKARSSVVKKMDPDSNSVPAKYVICEFVIPKDSRYVYVGKYGTHYRNCYASSDLIFKKVL